MRPHNFNAGPAVLPEKVLERVRSELLDARGTGHCVMEWSHRSPEYDEVRHDAEKRLRRLLGLPEGGPYRVLFLQGGASLQFAMLPMNVATAARPGGYVVTGVWAKKGLEEAERLGAGRCLWTGLGSGFTRLPEDSEWKASPDLSYVHITTNNTIYGTQWRSLPETGHVPLAVDMSSDILSEPRDHTKCALFYAGAQKNLGPAGLTVVVVRDDFLKSAEPKIPSILDYRVHVTADGIYNTHPTFAVYLMGLVLEWMEEAGGVIAMGQRNEEKASRLYAEIDRSGFYRGTAARTSRSRMNITFRLANESLEKRFLEEAERESLIGLKGHRSVGGIRASLYNALELSSVERLVDFMREFERRNG